MSKARESLEHAEHAAHAERFSLVSCESALGCRFAGHQRRTGLHSVHGAAVFVDGARDGPCVERGSTRRSDGASARSRFPQSDGSRRYFFSGESNVAG